MTSTTDMIKIDNSHRLIFVNIKNSYKAMINDDRSSLYYRENLKECTRKYWKISNKKAEAATHILGCYKGIVKEVIKISSFNEHLGRKIFEGDDLKNSKYIGIDIRDIFSTLVNFRIKYYNF